MIGRLRPFTFLKVVKKVFVGFLRKRANEMAARTVGDQNTSFDDERFILDSLISAWEANGWVVECRKSFHVDM